MATNLVSLVTQFLTPDVIGRIAAALGLDRGSAQTAIGAAVPALLAGLSSAAERPGGAQRLADAVKQQSGVLDSFASAIGGGGQSSLIDKGSNLLSSLLGGQDQSALAGAIAKFSGIGQGASGSLLAMLAPVVMGAIGKQFGPRGLDAGSLTNLLSAEQSQIAQAIPPGLGKLLGGTGLLDSIGGVAGSATAAAGHATRAASHATGRAAQFATSTVHAVGNAGQRGAGTATPNWLYWLVPLAVIAGLAWYLFANRADQATQQAATQQPATTGAAVTGIEVGKQLGDSLGSLRTSLQGITDAASARAALPKLQEITAQVDKANSVVGQLPSAQRRAVAEQVSPTMAAVRQLFDKVLAIPGVGEVLKPTIDSLKTKLATLTA